MRPEDSGQVQYSLKLDQEGQRQAGEGSNAVVQHVREVKHAAGECMRCESKLFLQQVNWYQESERFEGRLSLVRKHPFPVHSCTG